MLTDKAMNKKTVVRAGGGFIGGHLVAELLINGRTNVRAVDQKPLAGWYLVCDNGENFVLKIKDCRSAEGPWFLSTCRGRHG